MQLDKIIFGAMAYPGRDRDYQLRILRAAIEQGMTSIDTAPLYGAGESEEIVGKAIRGRRDSIKILTKCGLSWDSDHGEAMFRMDIDGTKRTVRKDSRRNTLSCGIDDSLRRLGTDYIDLMQIHHFDAATPLAETCSALVTALKAGKIRAIGVSNFSLASLQQIHRELGNALYSIQEEFSLLTRSPSQAVREYARANGLRFIAYSPLARGVLGGKYSAESRPEDWRLETPQLKQRNLERINAALQEYAVPLAKAYGVSIAAVCLCWALQQNDVGHVISGASNETQLADNLPAAKLQLPADALAELGDALAACAPKASSLSGSLRRRIVGRLNRLWTQFNPSRP